MKIDLITCSDAREDTRPEKLVEFMNEFPNVEIAVQAHPSKMSPGMPRRAWFEQLMHMVRNNPRPLNLALHMNMEYCTAMCRGNIPADVATWFCARRGDGVPAVRRWQINYSGSNTTVFNSWLMANMMHAYPDHEFILQHDCSETSFKYMTGLCKDRMFVNFNFAVLYDASGGMGVQPNNWQAPYPNHHTGYAGGLGPDNIMSELDKIARVAGDHGVWVDAESALKSPGTKTFDIARARQYVCAINEWNKKFSR